MPSSTTGPRPTPFPAPAARARSSRATGAAARALTATCWSCRRTRRSARRPRRSPPRVPPEERPRLVGEVDVLVRLPEAGPEAAPDLRRVRPAVAHADRLVVPELAPVRPRAITLPLDRAAGTAGLGLV